MKKAFSGVLLFTLITQSSVPSSFADIVSPLPLVSPVHSDKIAIFIVQNLFLNLI